MGLSDRNDYEDDFFRTALDELQAYVYITECEKGQVVYKNRIASHTSEPKQPEESAGEQELRQRMESRQQHGSLFHWEGRSYHIHCFAEDTEQKQAAPHTGEDGLTGLPNRRKGEEKLEQILRKAKEEQVAVTLVLYDVDGLKQINDRYGRGEGDRLICRMTQHVIQSMEKEDVMFRLGGDKFAAACYRKNGVEVRQRMEQALKQLKIEESSDQYSPSFSYGLTEVYPGENCTLSEVIVRADKQMYIQKRENHILRAQEELEQKERKNNTASAFQYDRAHLLEALQDSTEDYIFVGNMKTGVFQYSPSMVKEFGMPGEVVENAAAFWGRLVHPHDEKGFLESNQEVADGRAESHCIEYRAKNIRGEWIWLRCRGRMIRDIQGDPALFAGFITNLGKREQTDHVTGLSGRFSFEGSIKEALVDGTNVKRIGVMILNMDSFKNINDLYDQSFGDGILRLTAQKIAALLPENAAVYRLDGDEFGVIIRNGADGEYEKIYHSIHQQFQKQQEYNGRKYYCTISAGYASYPEDAENYLDLVRCANYSLEYSKLMGKNRVTGFQPEILEKKERGLELAELLRESIERGFAGFSVHYQPQVYAGTGKLYGAEALARWHSSQYGDISPGEFIPLLEQSGMIVQVGAWIFRQAAEICNKWCRNKPDFHMSVNLSYRQLQQGNLAKEVQETLKELKLSPDHITLELTETYLMKGDAATARTIEELRRTGISLAMDDFGVGYSSLFSLKNVPVDLVKIDREFVKGIAVDLFNATFIHSITELCHDVGKSVCLEGVETMGEYGTVKEIGLDLIQGFYFGRPETWKDFEEKWLCI